MNILLGFLSLFLLVEWPLSGSAMPSIHRANENQIYSPHILNKDKIAPYSHNSLLQRTAVANPLINNDHSHNQHGVYYHSQINLKPKDLPKKTLHFAGTAPLKSYGTQQNRNKKDETVQKWNAAATDVQKSLRPKDTVKKTTLSSKPRLTRNQGDQKKKKKQYIVANLGGLALGNGLALGIGGTPTASYGASLGTSYGANLAGNYGTGLGTMLVTGYGSEADNGVLTNRQTFGTNYGANSNSQSSTALGDLAGLNSLNSQAGLNYLSNLDSLGGTTDLNSLNSINQYQNSDLDILSSNANNGLDGFGSLTTGTAQNQRYAGHNALGSSLNSLQGKLTAAGGNRQGIGSMDLGMDDLGGNGMSDSSLQQILGQIMNGMGGDGGGGGRMGGHMRNSNSNDDLGGDVGNLDLGSLGVNLGMGNEVGNGMGNGAGNGMGNGMGSRIGNGLGNGMENGLGNSIEELGGMGANMGHEMGGMGNGLPNGMANSMENMGGAGGAGLAMGMGGMGEMGSMNQVGGMGHGFKIGGIHFGGHAAGTMGNQEESNTEMEDAQTSDSPDEQAFPGLMHRPLAIAPIVPGQTVHAHASDKPKRPKYPTMDISPVEMALKVQLKAHREHQRKLKELKMKLRRLREKLRKLKADYNYNDDEEETEKSEMETLKDLKQATEQAIRELQEEAVRASKRKGLKKLIFIHNIPDSKGHKPEFGKTNTLEDLGTDLLALIDSNTNKPTSGPVRDGPTRSRPPVFIPAAPTTERAEKKGPLHDDTQSLTQLEKQAEQEVDYIADKKKVKQQSLNTGLKIKIPEAVPVTQKGNAHAAVMTLKESTAPQASLPVHMRPQVIKTPDGQRLLNPIQLNNLAQILPEPVDNTRERKFQQSRPTGNGTMERKHAPDYFSIGCWRDQPQRALPSLEGIFPMLDGNDYKARQFAIKKCSVIARVQGFPAFALENGGQCLGGKDILETYNMYGASGACKRDGKGGPWSMEVYKFIRHIPARRGSISRIENQHRLSLSRSRP